MSNLDSFHPFRQTVNVRDEGAKNTNSENASNNENKEKEDLQYVPWLSWKAKFRLLIASLALIAITLIGNSVYDSLYPLLSPFGGHTPHHSQKSNWEGEAKSQLAFDKNDLNERGREVSHARKKAGFFASIFCKGGKKSSFCN